MFGSLHMYCMHMVPLSNSLPFTANKLVQNPQTKRSVIFPSVRPLEQSISSSFNSEPESHSIGKRNLCASPRPPAGAPESCIKTTTGKTSRGVSLSRCLSLPCWGRVHVLCTSVLDDLTAVENLRVRPRLTTLGIGLRVRAGLVVAFASREARKQRPRPRPERISFRARGEGMPAVLCCDSDATTATAGAPRGVSLACRRLPGPRRRCPSRPVTDDRCRRARQARNCSAFMSRLHGWRSAGSPRSVVCIT